MKKVTENASFQKRSPEWRFLKLSAFRLLVDGQKWRFSNTMIFCIIYYKPYACSVRDAIVFLLFWRFSMVGRKRIEYATCGRVLFCKRREHEISVFKNIRIHVEGALKAWKKNLKCVSVKRGAWVYLFLTNTVSGLRLRSGLGLTLTLSLTWP